MYHLYIIYRNSCTTLLYNIHKNWNLKRWYTHTPLWRPLVQKKKSKLLYITFKAVYHLFPAYISASSLTTSTPHTRCFSCNKLFVVPSLNKKLKFNFYSWNEINLCNFATVLSSYWNVLTALPRPVSTHPSDPAQVPLLLSWESIIPTLYVYFHSNIFYIVLKLHICFSVL